MSRLKSGWESLQERLSQSAETVTRNARIDIAGGDVDEIDPPEDIDEYADQAKETAIVRSNLRQFVQDVWRPGYRVEGPDETVAYFEGESDELDATPPEGTPKGGFLENCFVFGGEKRKDFYFGGKQSTWERWRRGTVLVEFLKADKEDAESEITGFYHIRPETVYPQVYSNTNILIDPDDTDADGIELTPRDEAAAYIQFDDESIIGLRREAYDNTEIPLSQNDVLKQTLEPDIGGDHNDDGVFGTSVMASIATDVEEYNEIKRDRARAVKNKAYGIWNAQFLPEVLDHGNGTNEIIRWPDEDIKDTEREIENMGPGTTLTSDAKIELEKFEGEVPELGPTLQHYINEILSALPAPKYTVGFGEEITQFVSERQENAYEDTIAEERHYQERSWTAAFKTVAKRQGLPTEGLKLKIEPEEDDSPIMSLSMDEIDKIDKYATALSELAGPTGGATTLVDRETLLTEVAQLPEDSIGEAVDEMESEMENVDEEAMHDDFLDIVGVEALQEWSEGEEVDTPAGLGVIVERRTSEFEGPDEETIGASEDNPAYVVGVEDGVRIYEGSELEEGEIDVDLDEPEEALYAVMDIAHAEGDAEALQPGRFNYPDSWQESDTPSRLILLKAWSGMGGTFTGCAREMRGEISSTGRFCGAMKDRVLGGWTGWRDGGD